MRSPRQFKVIEKYETNPFRLFVPFVSLWFNEELPNEPMRSARQFKVPSSRFNVQKSLRLHELHGNYQTKPSLGAQFTVPGSRFNVMKLRNEPIRSWEDRMNRIRQDAGSRFSKRTHRFARFDVSRSKFSEYQSASRHGGCAEITKRTHMLDAPRGRKLNGRWREGTMESNCNERFLPNEATGQIGSPFFAPLRLCVRTFHYSGIPVHFTKRSHAFDAPVQCSGFKVQCRRKSEVPWTGIVATRFPNEPILMDRRFQSPDLRRVRGNTNED
jgi:hypothetical protein